MNVDVRQSAFEDAARGVRALGGPIAEAGTEPVLRGVEVSSGGTENDFGSKLCSCYGSPVDEGGRDLNERWLV